MISILHNKTMLLGLKVRLTGVNLQHNIISEHDFSQ